ncbi:TRAG family protein [Leptothrix cholodnii SP-6]|uniref:TRAG family protein n=1 Tax=Leptothrix cholodnii (strain ATCC 51168 / LMG 8142 / SP-6) TaxID=395495 RepID=B1Y1V4_LEPCP|nr:type IV secretory system conjugative DNA transfer family protein [Leptothrix cholodnii]ACB33134.1 TRAG family protein [Leptothrix cholodnii SP-6]
MSNVHAWIPAGHWPAWLTPRRAAGIGFGLAAFVVLSVAAIYLSAALFLLLNKVDPRRVELTSLWTYWAVYSPDPAQRKRLLASMTASGIGLLLVLPGALLVAAQPRRRLHGDARFATTAEITRAGLLGGSTDGRPGILIGRHRGQFISLSGQLSVMLSAPTRSGKGVGVVIPNLLNWPDSVVVLDIKGENHAVTAGFRAKSGQRVYAFAPFDDQARSHRWNPLTAVRTSPMHRVGDLLAIGQVFYPNDGSGTSSEAFFNDQARNLFLGLGLLLLETPALPRTIGELLRQSSGKGRALRDHLADQIRGRRIDSKELGPALSDECIDALQRLLSNSENTLSSIVATFNAPLTIFADAVVDATTSADDFRFEDVRRQRLSIYVHIPPNRLTSARPLLNLFFSQLVSLNTQQLPEHDPSLTVQCLLVNDEFTTMGRVGVITMSAAFLAGYNLRLLTVVQAMSQLDAVYGDKEARTFATNHGLQILFAPREQRDADEYSAMLGHFTERGTSRGHSRSLGPNGSRSVSVNESEQRRALLLPQEFKELGSERLVVIAENCKPVLGEKIRYHRDPAFTSRLLPPPEVPALDMDLHLARVQQRWRLVEGDLAPDETVSIERLAHDINQLPDHFTELSAQQMADACLDFFSEKEAQPSGGTVEAAADEEGVLISNDVAREAAPTPDA